MQIIEGIVIKAIPFKDHDRILTVFTSEQGLVKLLIKGAESPRQKLSSATSPLTLAEFVFYPGKGDISFCREVTPINHYLFLRENYSVLDASSEMLNSIYRSQWGEKNTHQLYALLLVYLKHIKEAVNPYTVSSSFLLKTMRHEGLLHLSDTCHVCLKALDSWHLFQGDTFCSQHSPPQAIQLTVDEALMLTTLATSRSLKEILTANVEASLRGKIQLLFQESISLM